MKNFVNGADLRNAFVKVQAQEWLAQHPLQAGGGDSGSGVIPHDIGGRTRCITCRCRLTFRSRAWKELGVSMAAGGGVVPIAPAATRANATPPPSDVARGTVATDAAARLTSAYRTFSYARSLTTQPPYRATLPEFILQKHTPQCRAKDAPNPFTAVGVAVVVVSNEALASITYPAF
ncbi:unnamed protein product [Arctia plantaginis]|uniref:Uncharacterized protein n=1 Tax=Arctia plantaginis TaxID=874455 RepID=A0A8S1BK89_ARCPL|nr:unnamed protein product [Arctia plantaginis]